MKTRKRSGASQVTAIETPEERKRRLKYERTKRDRTADPERYAAYARRYRAKHGHTKEYRQRKAEQDRSYREKKGDDLLAKKREYYRKNRDAIKAKMRVYKQSLPDEVRRARQRESYHRNKQAALARTKRYTERYPERAAARNAAWKQANKERLLEHQRHRLKADPQYALVRRVRCRIAHAIRTTGARKSNNSLDLLGCEQAELARHIESQFLSGMTWENRSLWHVDHIIPLAAFDLSCERQQRVAFHYANLRPLWGRENQTKNARMPLGVKSAPRSVASLKRVIRRLAEMETRQRQKAADRSARRVLGHPSRGACVTQDRSQPKGRRGSRRASV